MTAMVRRRNRHAEALDYHPIRDGEEENGEKLETIE